MEIFSFEKLEDAQSLEITSMLQSQVQFAAENSFPDDVGVTYTVTKAVQTNGKRYVEITADHGTFVFELNTDHTVSKCYDFDGDSYTLLFD